MSFLGKLSSRSAKPRVYISVTPGVGVEMIQLDLNGGAVANYAVKELAYNETSRDIVDYGTFKEAVAEMYQRLGVNPNCEVVVNMPQVLFGTMQVGLLVNNDQITGAVQSEVEQSYIFKRSMAASAWLDAPSVTSAPGQETRQILYSAIQRQTIESLKTALSELGSTLVGVETSIPSTLRALEYMGVTSDQMKPNVTWNLMIVNSTGYSLISMSGRNVVDYFDEPLAIKSFEGDEIYNAINQSAQIALMSYPANYLYIVSDTDQVSATLLASKLQTTSTVDFLENNSFKQAESLIPVSLNVLQDDASKISLQAIGCALANVSDFPLKFNFVDETTSTAEQSCTIMLGEQEIVLTPSSAMKIVVVFALVLLAITALLTFVLLPTMITSVKGNIDDVSAKIKNIDTEIASYDTKKEGSTFNAKSAVENGIRANRSKLMNYTAAGDAIPKSVWLTYFMTQGDGLVDIKGVSTNVEDVYVFFKNMRDSLIGTKLRLQKLEMESQSVEAAVSGTGSSNYSFEITNMTEDQLTTLMQPVQAVNNAVKSTGNNSGLLSNQPIQGQ